MQPQTTSYNTRVRWAAPQAIGIARALGWLYGKAIAGDNGTIRYGYPSIQNNRTKYAGYVYPPQLFVGYDPAKVAGGFVRPDPSSLPGESMSSYAGSNSPIAQAMAAVTQSQMAAP